MEQLSMKPDKFKAGIASSSGHNRKGQNLPG
jgi:hypothetical protein